MTIEKLKEYKFEEIMPLILDLGRDINDPEIEIQCDKFGRTTNSTFQRELFYTWANTLINKYDLNFIREIRRKKIKKIEASGNS